MSLSKDVLTLGFCLIFAAGLLSACQPEPSAPVTPTAAVSTPVATVQITPTVNTVPAQGLIINEDPPRSSLFHLNTLAYELPRMDEVEIINVTYAYRGERPLTLDIYYPPGTPEHARLPVVVFGLGYRMSREPLRKAHFYTSWGRLVAAAGMVGISYDTEQPDQDLEMLMAFIRANAPALRIEADQIGLWSSSANVPTVMSYLMQENRDGIRFSVYYYGLSLTPDQKYTAAFGEICAMRGCLVNELADVAYVDPEVPLLIVKAGLDFIPIINEGMDHFVNFVEEAGADVTVIEYEGGTHGFDTELRTEESAEIIAETMKFMLLNFGLE